MYDSFKYNIVFLRQITHLQIGNQSNWYRSPFDPPVTNVAFLTEFMNELSSWNERVCEQGNVAELEQT